MDIGVHDFQRPLEEWVEHGKTVSSWSEITIIRVAQELLATLRDFGVLEGALRKELPRPFSPLSRLRISPFIETTPALRR